LPDALRDIRTAPAGARPAQAPVRRGPRAVSSAIVVLWAAVLAVSALLPTTGGPNQTAQTDRTDQPDRTALLIVAGLVLIDGVALFAAQSGRAIGSRVLVAGAAIAQGGMLVAVGVTGGAASAYFPYYLLPVLVTILSGSWRAAGMTGGLAVAGL